MAAPQKGFIFASFAKHRAHFDHSPLQAFTAIKTEPLARTPATLYNHDLSKMTTILQTMRRRYINRADRTSQTQGRSL